MYLYRSLTHVSNKAAAASSSMIAMLKDVHIAINTLLMAKEVAIAARASEVSLARKSFVEKPAVGPVAGC